jgi:hypothetical protein
VFDFRSIVGVAAVLSLGGCAQQAGGAQGQRHAVPDSHEMRVAPGRYQLSYAASGHAYDEPELVQHWRERAASVCVGAYRGLPLAQTQYPEPGFDALTSYLSVAAVRSFNVEVYGVAHCFDAGR